MGRKETQIPPRSASTVNLNAQIMQSSAETADQPVPDISGIDFEVLFQCNSEYISVTQHLKHLENQLEVATKDIETLKRMKEEALESPDEFVKFLADSKSRSSFPKLQEIISIPNLDINKYQIRLTRRANTRFEQNLEYLSARVHEVQTRLPLMRAPRSSVDLPVSNEFQKSGNGGKRPFSEMRSSFLECLGNNPGALKLQELDHAINPNSPMMQNTPSAVTVHQPKPRQAPRFNPAAVVEDLTDLNPMDYHSRGSSRSASVPPVPITPVSIASTSNPSTPSNNSNSIKIRIRKPSSQAPENTSITHNIPWSDDEKRKLDYLLTVFPEEDIQARRYAKIAAALGTRTGNQVASRIQKIAAKAQRHKERALRNNQNVVETKLDEGTAGLVAELEEFFAKSTDPAIRSTPEYAEYLRLKGQLEAIAKNPVNGALHVGYRCDSCGIEPIIGPRWTCCSCPKDAPSIDLCGSCVSKGFESGPHKSSHVMKKIDFSDDVGDEDA